MNCIFLIKIFQFALRGNIADQALIILFLVSFIPINMMGLCPNQGQRVPNSSNSPMFIRDVQGVPNNKKPYYEQEDHNSNKPFLQPIDSSHTNILISINQSQMVIFTILFVDLLDGLSRFQNYVFHLFVFEIVPSAKEIQPLDFDLVVEVIHCLLDWEIFFKQYERNLWRGELFRGCLVLYVKYGNAIRVLGMNVSHDELGSCQFVLLVGLFVVFEVLVVLVLVCGW